MLKCAINYYSSRSNELRRLLRMRNKALAYRYATKGLLEYLFVNLINFEVWSLENQMQVVWRPGGISKERDRELV